MDAMDALKISNRDKRIIEYQDTVHRLRAENARLREVLQACITDLETAYDAAKRRSSNLEVTLGMWRRLNTARAALAKVKEDA